MQNNIPDEDYYDVIIMGSDLKQILLFGLLSNCTIDGKKLKIILLSENQIFGCNHIGLSYNDIQKYKCNISNSPKSKKEDSLNDEFEIQSLWHIDIQ